MTQDFVSALTEVEIITDSGGDIRDRTLLPTNLPEFVILLRNSTDWLSGRYNLQQFVADDN